MEDLTGRARLRDAAIECFAREGFGASVRAIAARAGVSAGLVRHHFGSKDELRAECDRVVFDRYHALKEESLAREPSTLFGPFLRTPEIGILLVYILRCVHEGGEMGRRFVDRLVDESEALVARSVAEGLIKPSRDERARARFLVEQSIGGILVHLLMRRDADLGDPAATLAEVVDAVTLPTLELYTGGVFTDARYFDAYVAHTRGADDAPAASATSDDEGSTP